MPLHPKLRQAQSFLFTASSKGDAAHFYDVNSYYSYIAYPSLSALTDLVNRDGLWRPPATAEAAVSILPVSDPMPRRPILPARHQ
jgi:hypothetical protein